MATITKLIFPIGPGSSPSRSAIINGTEVQYDGFTLGELTEKSEQHYQEKGMAYLGEGKVNKIDGQVQLDEFKGHFWKKP